MAASSGVPRARLRLRAGFDLLFPLLYGFGVAVLGVFLQLRFFPIGDIDLETDFYGDLVIAARKLSEGQFTVHDYPWKGPLYAFALVLARSLAGDWYRGAVVLSAVAGGLYLTVAYRLLLRLFDRRAAVLTTITASLVLEFFVQFHRASTDVLFLLLSLGSTSCVLLARGSMYRLAAAGVLAAFAFLTRYNGVFLVANAALVLVVVNPDGLGPRQRVKGLGLFLIVFLLVCAPWFTKNWLETGRILATRNVENVVATFFGGSRWQDDPAASGRSLPGLIAMQPAWFLSQYARNLVQHLWKDLTVLLGWPLALVPIAGILGFALRPPTRRQASLYLFAAVYWLFMGIVFYAPRFSLPMVLPYLAVGFALVQGGGTRTTRWGWLLRGWLQSRGLGRAALGVLGALALALVLVQVRRLEATERMIFERRPLFILDAARVLGQRVEEHRPRLLARKGHIAYYAGFDFSPYSTSVGSLEELVQHARSEGAEYVVYSKIEYSMLPRMLFLAVSDTVPLLHEIYRGPSIRIFRLGEDSRTTLTDPERLELLGANLRAARAQGRPGAIYIALEDLGSHYMRRREFRMAAARFREAIQVAERADGGPEMTRAAAVARHNLATAHVEIGQAELAIPLLQKNLGSFASHGSRRDLARTHDLLGRAHAILGRADEAREEHRRAHELYPQGDEGARSDSLGPGMRSE